MDRIMHACPTKAAYSTRGRRICGCREAVKCVICKPNVANAKCNHQNHPLFYRGPNIRASRHPKRPLSKHALFFIYVCTLLTFPFWPAGGAVVPEVFPRASPEVFSPGSFCLLPVRSRVRKDNSSPESGTSGTETQHQQIHTPVLSVNGSQVPSTVPGKVSG